MKVLLQVGGAWVDIHSVTLYLNLHYTSGKGSNPRNPNAVKTWHLASTMHYKVRLSAGLICSETGDFGAFAGRTPGLLV